MVPRFTYDPLASPGNVLFHSPYNCLNNQAAKCVLFQVFPITLLVECGFCISCFLIKFQIFDHLSLKHELILQIMLKGCGSRVFLKIFQGSKEKQMNYDQLLIKARLTETTQYQILYYPWKVCFSPLNIIAQVHEDCSNSLATTFQIELPKQKFLT